MRSLLRFALTFASSWTLVLGLATIAGAVEPGRLAERARLVEFEVGTAIDTHLDDARRELATLEFTSATIENRLKWAALSAAPGIYDFSPADEMVELAEQRGLRVRGHTLFWHRLNGMPKWLEGEVTSAPNPAARLTELMEDHATTVVERYAGRLAHWDVVNEPLSLLFGNFFFQILGESWLDIAFHSAHAADPEALLFLNETLTEFRPPKFDGLVNVVEGMLARGVPVHGVGLQGHFGLWPPDRALLRDQLERIAALGLVVELREVDIPLPLFVNEPDPLGAQAEAYADVFAACLAVPACTGITVWGVDDSRTWLDTFILTRANAPNRPLLFDEELSPKPAYHAAVAELELLIEPVDLDVKPESETNHINLSSRGVIPVAILGSPALDVHDIDPESLGFGLAHVGIAHKKGPHYQDVDDDGAIDLMAHFRTSETGIEPGDVEVCASGRISDGAAFEGCDAIITNAKQMACGIGWELAFVVPLLGGTLRRFTSSR
jgi:endo-1,4-beta-xylanase